MVSAAFRTIFAPSEPAAVKARRDGVAHTLEARFPEAAVSMRDAKLDVIAFAQFPVAHLRKIRSNNPLEWLNKEIKRRTNVVGVFPNDTAMIRLAGAVLADLHDDWIVARRYVTDSSLANSTPRATLTPPQSPSSHPATAQHQTSRLKAHHPTGLCRWFESSQRGLRHPS